MGTSISMWNLIATAARCGSLLTELCVVFMEMSIT